MLKCAGAAALGLALFAAPAPPQTAAEQMQKAIYAQQTAGDLDTAIQIYRQILTSSGADRKTAAAAQFRLGQALLQKGDLTAAAREFQMLADYSEYKDVIAALAGRTRESNVLNSRGTYSSYGRGESGHYINSATGVAFLVPAGWSFDDAEPSGGGEMAHLWDPKTQLSIWVWMKAEQHPVAELAALLRHDLEVTPPIRADLEGWKILPDTVGTYGGGDHQYLRAVAQFVLRGQRWYEPLIWARSTKTHVMFFARFPETYPGDVHARFEEVRNSAVIP
jgi:hypothetical protein